LQLTRVFRRISVSGGAPETLSVKAFIDRGDLSQDGRLIYQTSPDSGEVYDLRTRQRRSIGALPGDPLWSRDGQTFAYVVSPGAGKPSDAGLWIGTINGARRQVFQGWLVSFAWADAQSMLVLEGRPDFKGVLWRVDSEGRRTVVLSGVGLYRSELDLGIYSIRFDVHPDGRRIAIETLESLEADIGMIGNVR